MKHTFIERPNGTHTRNSDNVVGILKSYPDEATVQSASPLVDPADFTEINPPTPADPTVPDEIANWRAKAVLGIAGLLTTVEAALAAMPGDAGVVARAAWDAGAPLVRNGPTVTALSAQLGLTDEQVDAMFIQAASLEV